MERTTLEEIPAVQSDPLSSEIEAVSPPMARRRLPASTILSFVAGLVGVAAIAASAWVYAESRRDRAGMSGELAQIRAAIERLNQPQPAETAATDSDGLLELSNRLAVLEQSWRRTLFAPGEAAIPVNPTPAFTPPPAPAAEAASGDCLPTGTRFMVAAGDSYPVCGTPAKVEIGAVDNGYITLSDGTVIAQGGTVGLPASQCMIAVVPSDGGAISGFAEIRVTC